MGRLEGDDASGLQFLNLCVGSPRNATAKSTPQDQRSNKRMSWQVVDVRKVCTHDRTFWISTDVLQDAQFVLDLDNTQEWRARVEQEMLDKGDAI